MANFYARDRGYSDYHLELPIEKMAQKELKKGSNKIESLKANAALVKQQKAGYLSALNNKYKIQRANVKENWDLTQANYDLIFKQEQANAQRQFEVLQANRGNPGPKQAQGLGSLMDMAPALADMVGNYVEQEKIFRNKATTNLILDKGASGATISKWSENRELIASNSLEAKIFARHEAAKLGVDISTEEMLSIIDLYGERDMAAMTAIAHNSARNYQLFLGDPANQSMEIVLDGGVTKTWGDIRKGQNPVEFASAQAQMRGHFMEKHQISVTDQVPGILDSIGKNVRQVEAQELGRYHNQLNQYNDDRLETHESIRWQNAFDSGSQGVASHLNTLSYEYIDTTTGKPDRNRAFNDLTDWIERGLRVGTINSKHVQDAIDANGGRGGQWRELKLDTLLEQARIQEFNSEAFELKIEAARQEQGIQSAVDHFFSQDGFNGQLPISQAQYHATLIDSGLSRESASKVISLTGSTGGIKSRMPEERYKAFYEAGETDAIAAIKSKVINNPSNKIVLKDTEGVKKLEGYSQLEVRMKTMYAKQFQQLLRERGDDNIASIMQDAKNNTLEWLEANPDYTTLSSDTTVDETTGEVIQVPNSERTFQNFTGPTGEKPTLSLTLDKLNDHPGISPRNVILGIEQGNYEPVVDAREIGSYLQGGSWNVLSFENSSLGRALSRQTGLPASLILAIHAEKQGFKPLTDEEYIDLEEFDSLPEGIKKVMNCNSSDSGAVCQAALNPELRQPPSYAYGIGGLTPMSATPGNQSTTVGGYDMSRSNTPKTGQALAFAILGGEGGWDSINPGIVDRRISKSTAAEAWKIAMSYTSGSSAMGAFQHMPSINNKNVLKQRWEDAGLDWENDLFSPENQVRMNWHFIKSIYPGVEQDLAAGNLRRVMSKLRGTWPSIPGGSQENAHSADFENRYYRYLNNYDGGTGTGMPSNYRGGYRGALEV